MHNENTPLIEKIKARLAKIKNIGIIAHIDAGKTTLTEMLLYYSGNIHKFGCVHTGDTTTDHLQQERQRGITIVSASVCISWKGVDINLLDTPGHLDFNNEVEKCLCVLEGAVVVIDGSAGVEPQTECVWEQANNYQVSRIIFVNKMDKANANFEASMESLKARLSNRCIPIFYPYLVNYGYVGIYNLIEKCRYIDKGNGEEERVEFKDLPQEEQDLIAAKRTEMIDSICSLDDEAAMFYLDNPDYDWKEEELHELIRKLVLKRELFPVMCGSAFKDSGVRYILDHIIKYLPSPEYTNCQLQKFNNRRS